MKVKQKLKSEPEEGGGAQSSNLQIKTEFEDLTPEDEERRRRRRERNKVAATKCRNKKKEKTHILVAESEIVTHQNASLKAEVARLDAEKRHLTSILALHEPNCSKRRRMCSSEDTTRSGSIGEDCYDLSQTFRRPVAPGDEGDRMFPGLQGAVQDPTYTGGYSTNRQGPIEDIENEISTAQLEVFKTEPKDYKYSSDGSGEVFDVCTYSLMRQPASLPDYSATRNLSYTGGYYDHMCLAL